MYSSICGILSLGRIQSRKLLFDSASAILGFGRVYADSYSCPSKEQCYMDVFGLEWDPSYDLPDTSWVDESFWDNFDGDMYDFEQENTYDNDYMNGENRGMNEKATDDASIDDIRANDTRTDDGH